MTNERRLDHERRNLETAIQLAADLLAMEGATEEDRRYAESVLASAAAGGYTRRPS
jgi:hypothetical protein